MSSIREGYPLKLLPTQLNTRTGKAKKIQYEKIDKNLYDEQAKMVAFYTSVERLQPWIKALSVLYYDNFGKRKDVNIHWFDSPDHWTDPNSNANSVVFELKDENNVLLYGITFFVTTGTIRAQGQHYTLFADYHFPILLQILERVLENENEMSESDSNIEHGVSDLSDNELDTTMMNPLVPDIHTPPSSDMSDRTSEKETYTPCTLVPHLSAVSTDADRLQVVLLDAISKMEVSRAKDTQKIIDAISDTDARETQNILTAINNLSKAEKPVHVDLQSEQKSKELQEENRKLKADLHIEKNKASLTKAHYEDLQNVVKQSSKEVEFAYKRLEAKNGEIEALETTVTELKSKLSDAESEIISLKEHIGNIGASNLSSLLSKNRQDDTEPNKSESREAPFVLLLGTSNIKDIREDKVTKAALIEKHITYTLEQAKQCIDNFNGSGPQMLILHVLTNDLKHKAPEVCVNEFINIIEGIHLRWPKVIILVSTATPRLDDAIHHFNGQIINAMLKKKLTDPVFKYTKLIEHPSLYKNGAADPELLVERDGVHLVVKGVSILAADFKAAIHDVLNIPVVRGRGPGRDHPLRRERSFSYRSGSRVRGGYRR
ncbi:hypothetical protein FSP39_012376 [Pinctada imbricata]|uniref:Uncharacterized protein n=1 Tax=Pinctada imbricata TaxID=66713 RepID=A0AA88YEC3_PINIB|nr:hypothetical protein FSP39_012376 [Pinctada imbricata]